jgi:lipoate-protein ligase A
MEAEPFLCFKRRSSADLVMDVHKVLGSAQRNRRGVLLQHGSILLKRSDWTPELLGLFDMGIEKTPEELAGEIMQALSEAWDYSFDIGELTEMERARAMELETVKYASLSWTRRR